jgi:hypothetical protein
MGAVGIEYRLRLSLSFHRPIAWPAGALEVNRKSEPKARLC